MTTFSWSTRIKGFCILFVIGILLSFLGCFALFLKRGLNTFAIFYTLGNVVSLLSTCFLMGPINQLKNMFAQKRIIATIIVIASICMTLVAALVVRTPVLLAAICSDSNNVVLLFAVTQGWRCPALHHHTIAGHDLVLAIVHSIRPRCGQADGFRLCCVSIWLD